MTHHFCLPNYEHSILSLSNSLLKHYGAPYSYQTLPQLDNVLEKNYKNVVFMIFDGMGVELLRQSLSQKAFLHRQMKEIISSVCPPTTTAAVTTFYSALPPICHGWLGWCTYFKEHDKIIELFRDNEFYSQQKLNIQPVADLLPYEHIFEKIKKATDKTVGITEIFPAFKSDGAKTLSEVCHRIKKATRKNGRQFILTYWTEPDHQSHEEGPYHPSVKACLKDINQKVRSLSGTLSDTLIIISADHGHIPVEGAIYLNEYPDLLACLALPLSLEERCNAVFVKEGMHTRFKELFNQHLSTDFCLMSVQDALETNLFGEGIPHLRARDFLGDFIILSRAGISLRQCVNGLDPSEGLKGVHAGVTRAEMEVPLILIEKSA